MRPEIHGKGKTSANGEQLRRIIRVCDKEKDRGEQRPPPGQCYSGKASLPAPMQHRVRVPGGQKKRGEGHQQGEKAGIVGAAQQKPSAD
ncbi:MAG: hypothetical protein Q7J52_19750, partial [Falsiroseomonas sp.]|nr:hypothetical protein [Falsiroseomonas sp.]